MVAIAGQTPTEPLLCGETWGFGANGEFLFALSNFSLVAATSILAATERDGATFRRKKNYLLLGATEEATATITVGGNFFLFRGLTNKEISVIMGLRRKMWG